MTDTPTQHVYPALVARYRKARCEWRRPGVADAAENMGLDEQAYCRQFVADKGQIVTQTSTVSMENVAWLEGAAYDEAGVQDARASALGTSVGRAGQIRP
jgi:anti-sigma factor ChrR (cupin superfamily)